MKTRYLILSGLLALTLAACSQEKTATTEAKSSTEQKTVEEGTAGSMSQEASQKKAEVVNKGDHYSIQGKYDEIVVANKHYPMSKDYNPGENPTARQKVNKLISDAQALGLNVSNQVSGFRAYDTQAGLYNNYVASHGKQEADRFSARPGFSEHQTGLVFDLIDNQGQLLGAEGTNESSKKATTWLDKNAHKYGFIVRYKPEFVDKTGYMEESWHIRYAGEDVAKTIYEKNISLEEYLNAPGGDYAN